MTAPARASRSQCREPLRPVRRWLSDTFYATPEIADRGEPGVRYWLRTGLANWASTAASMTARAAGVAMTWTVQSRSRAGMTRAAMAVAGPAPQTMIDSTRWGELLVTRLRRSG